MKRIKVKIPTALVMFIFVIGLEFIAFFSLIADYYKGVGFDNSIKDRHDVLITVLLYVSFFCFIPALVILINDHAYPDVSNKRSYLVVNNEVKTGRVIRLIVIPFIVGTLLLISFSIAVFNYDNRYIDEQIQYLSSDDEQISSKAASALGEFRESRSVDYLIFALNEKGRLTRIAAAEALGKINVERGYEPLFDAFKYDDDIDVNVAAVNALISIGNGDFETELISELNSYGSTVIAEIYLNCGNERLKKAAESWAKEHNYKIVGGGSSGGAAWGNSN